MSDFFIEIILTVLRLRLRLLYFVDINHKFSLFTVQIVAKIGYSAIANFEQTV
jgi:hypothetical protein